MTSRNSEFRQVRRVLGWLSVLVYLVLTLAGSYHWHHLPQDQSGCPYHHSHSPVDHCGCPCPAGHGDDHDHHPVDAGHDDHHPLLTADADTGDDCRLCIWATAWRTEARPAGLADEAPVPAGFVRVADGPGPDSISPPPVRTRGPPAATLHTYI